MADNPRLHSAKDAMMAEMIITEIEKLEEHQKKILESSQYLAVHYESINGLLQQQRKDLQEFATYVKSFSDYVNKYGEMTKTAVHLAESLATAKEQGIGISEESRQKIFSIFKEGNKPIQTHLLYFLVTMGCIFVLLFVVAAFM